MTEQIINLLRDLGEKLGQTVEQLWPHAVRYVALDALATIIGSASFLVFAWLAWKIAKNYKYQDEDGEAAFAAKIVTTIITVIAAFVFVINVSSNIAPVLEPTGYLVVKAITKTSK